jgi:hypothetical protein
MAKKKDDVQLIGVRLPREVHDQLRRWAFEHRKPIAEAIRNATSAWLDQEGVEVDPAPAPRRTKKGKK